MKARFLHGAALWTFLFATTLATGCSDDNDYKDVDGQKPTLELASEHVRTLNGYEFKIAGKVADKDGIRSIRLQSPDLYLDKTIDLVALYPETLYEYDLNYGFTIPEETEGDEFTVKVTVTDLGGRTMESNVLITMDGDYTEPEIISTSFPDNIKIVLSEDNPMTFRFTAEDNKGLAYLELGIPDLNISERVDLEGEGITQGTFEKAITFPSDGIGAYIMTIRAVDAFNNITEKDYTMLISQTKDYNNMYLVDFEGYDDTALTDGDLWGVPMPIEHSGMYEYKARYYSAAENTPVRFVANKGNFNICFGEDKNNPGQLTNLQENIQPIILPKIGYYEIIFNIETQKYTVTAYKPSEEPYSGQFGLAGDNWVGTNGWNSSDPRPVLDRDTDNPYLYTTTLTFDASHNSFNCTLTAVGPGWPSPSWRFVNGGNGVDEHFCIGDAEPNGARYNIPAGKYTFIFDTHLVQSKLLKKNN